MNQFPVHIILIQTINNFLLSESLSFEFELLQRKILVVVIATVYPMNNGQYISSAKYNF